MKILALDSSSKAVSTAFVDDGKLICEYFGNLNTTHSQTLMPMLSSLLGTCGLTIANADAIAVTNGPGSFTGLRIALAAAKGLATAACKPVLPISTLESLAFNLAGADGFICPVMDARREQVYTALFTCTHGETPQRIWPDSAMPAEELLTALKNLGKPVFLVGDGALLCYNMLDKNQGLIKPASPNLLHQRASSTALAAYQHVLRGSLSPIAPAQLFANYLRKPQAERELLEKLKVSEEK